MGVLPVFCEYCSKKEGTDRILAELYADGRIGIKRKHTQFPTNSHTTFIKGENFEIICGHCLGTVFVKQSQGFEARFDYKYFGRKDIYENSSNIRITWPDRNTFNSGTYHPWVYGSVYYPGTAS